MDGKKNDIRPPLVGQASTSSNESSIDLHENNSSADEETKKIGLYTFEPRPRYEGAPASSESSDKNSNDEIQIITQIPRVSLDRNYPVGCSNVTSADTSLELPDGRIPTPSSVSSINSKRGLEWDNLGDVGYSNVHSASLSDTLGEGGGDRDSCTIGQDTLERIVSMETERRFDPEGTTESLGNPLPLTPMPPLPANTPSLTILSGAKPLQFQLGKPVAESTPNSNNQTARDYKNGSKEYNASNRDYSGSNKDYSGSNKDKSGPNREYIASSRDYVGSGSNREYPTTNKEYSGPNNEYNTANKDYSNPSKEYSTSKKDYSSFNKEHASYRDHSSNQGATSNVFANKGNRNVQGTVDETYDGPRGNRNNDAAVGQIYDGPLGNSDGTVGHYEAPFGSSSDNDPITEYEIRKKQRSDGVPSDRRSHKSEGDKGEDRRNQKSGDSQRMYSKHCMERNEHCERDKDNVEERDGEKDRERLVKRDEAKKRSGEGSGHRRSEREATDGRKDKKKEDRGMSGDFEEVLAKYGRGRTRREDIGGSSQRSGGSKSASHSSSSQPHWGSSSRSSSRKTYDSSDVPSSSKNSPSSRENLEQSNEQLKIDTENLAPTVGTVGSNKNSPTVHSNPTFNNESYSSCEKPTFEATTRPASHEKGHRSGEHATDVADRVRKTTGSEREGNDEKAVDQCRKNNEHIKQIVEKYNESLKQHRQQLKQTDQQHKQHQQHQNLQYPHKYQQQQHESPQQHIQHPKHREQYSQHRNHDQQIQQPTKTIPQEQLKQTEHPKNYPHHLSQQEHQQAKKKESFLPPISLKEVRPSTSGHEKSTNKSLTSRLPRKATSYERVDRILPEDTSTVETLEEIYFRESRPIRNQLQGQINTDTYKVNSSLEQINDERKNHRVREKDMRNPLQLKHRRKYYRLFPHCTEDGSGLRRTNSLEHMLDSEGLKSSTLPRYHSVSSLTLDGNEDSGCYDGDYVQGNPHHHPMLLPPLPPPYSASSSSLSTIITKRADAEASPRRLSKLSQTSSAVQSSVTTQTVPCTQDGGVCTVHPRRTGCTQHIAPSHNTSDVEDNVLLIRESNPGDCKTNCNTLDSIGSEETAGSWVGKTYYNNRYERKPDGENLEDNPGKYPTRKPKPKMPLPPDASPNERSPESVNGPFNVQSSRVTSPYNDRLFSEMYNTRDGYNNEGRSSDGGRDVDNQDLEVGEADNPDGRLQTVERSDQIDRVNSFEYLPGAVYEQNQATQNSSSDDLEEEKDDLDPEPEVNALSHSVSSSSLSSTLQCDVITGVNFIQDLLAHSSNSKKFIKHFVHTLIKNSSHDLVDSHGARKSIGVNAPYSKNFGQIERENRKYKTSCEQRPLNVVVKATEPIELSQKKIDESPDEEFGVGNCVRSETLRNDARCVERDNGDCAGENQNNGAQYYENNKHDFSGKNKGDYIRNNNHHGNHVRNGRQCIENGDFTGNYRKNGDHIRDKHVHGMNHIRNGPYCEKANGDFTETNKKNGDYIRNKNVDNDDNIQNSKQEYTEQRNNSRQCNGKTNPGRIRHDYQGVDHNKQSLQNNHTKKIDVDKHRTGNMDVKNREGDRFENGTDPNSRYRNEKDRYGNDIGDKNRYRNTILHQNVPFTPVSAAVEGREEQSREENISGESATKSSMGVLSDVTPERDGEHTTSSDFFKPSPKAYNLQPSILFARAHSTTLTSEEDSHRQSLTLPAHKNKLRPLSPPNQPNGQYVSEPTDSRSEEEPAAITRQEMALRRLYEKQSQANRNKLNQSTSRNNATNTHRAVSAGVQVKSILTNRKRDSADTSPTLSSHPSPPSPSKVGGANGGDDNWRSPVTESEKLYAMRQRAGVGQPNGKTAGAEDKDPLVGYLQLERQNQLDWIKAEIDHLNNLKDLLEKQETLKRSLSAYKQTRRIRKTLTQASSSTQPVQPGVSEPAGGSNLRPTVQESAGPKLDARLGGEAGDKNLKAAEKDGESIYAHKMDKDRASREERGRLLLPCEHKRKRSVPPPSSLKLKHNINEMMTRSVQTLQLDKHAKSKVSSAPEPTTSVAARPGPSIESTAIQTSDSILNLPHWLHQPQSVQPSLLAQDKSSDRENSVCPCLAALVSRLEEGREEGEGREGLRGMGRCKCYGGEEKAGVKSRKDTPPPVGYVITFQPRSNKSKKLKPKPIEPDDKASSTGGTSSDTDITTKPRVKSLQEYLEENRPDYVSRAEVRRQCLAEKSYLREQLDSTQHKQRVLLAALQCGDSPSPDTRVKPRGPGVRKIFTTRELRSMTRRRYLNLPEVQIKKMDAKRKEDYRTNKLMAEVFTKKLQRKALKGVVDLSNSDQVLGQIS